MNWTHEALADFLYRQMGIRARGTAMGNFCRRRGVRLYRPVTQGSRRWSASQFPDQLKGESPRAPGDIHRGDLFWLVSDEAKGSIPPIGHPHLVIQDDVFNRSRIHSVLVRALTSARKKASGPGDVLLDEGEGGLPRRSVLVVSQVTAVDSVWLGGFIRALSNQRVEQVLAGMRFQKLPSSGDGARRSTDIRARLRTLKKKRHSMD